MERLQDQLTIEPIAPGAMLVPIFELKKDDQFIYIGGDVNDWNTVTKVEGDVIYYNVGRSHIPGVNYKLSRTLHVWKKGGENENA